MISALHPPITPNTPRDRLQHRLEMQSFLIEDVLNQYATPPLTVTGGHAGTRVMRYDVPSERQRLPVRTIERELETRLGVPVELRQSMGGWTISVRRDEPPVNLAHLIALYATPAKRPYTALLGIDSRALPVELDLRESGHVLISGDAGSGKSSLLQTLVTTAAAATRPGRMQFLFIRGPHDTKLDVLNYLPAAYYRQPVIQTPQEAAAALTAAANQTESNCHLVIVIDNAARILEAGRFMVLSPLVHLLTRKRLVTVVMATRDGRGEPFHTLGDAFDTCILGRQVGQTTAVADQYLLGGGDFMLVQQRRYFQAGYADPFDLSYILARLQSQ